NVAAAQVSRYIKDGRALRLVPGDEVIALRARRHHVLELPAEETAVEVDRRLRVGFARIHPAGDAGDVSVAFGHLLSPRLVAARISLSLGLKMPLWRGSG